MRFFFDSCCVPSILKIHRMVGKMPMMGLLLADLGGSFVLLQQKGPIRGEHDNDLHVVHAIGAINFCMFSFFSLVFSSPPFPLIQ